MPKDTPVMDPETVAAQREVFEQVVKAGENYLFALAQCLFVSATNGPDLPSEIKGNLKISRKQLLDILQATLMNRP